MNFQEEIQKLPAYNEFGLWYIKTHKITMDFGGAIESGGTLMLDLCNFIELPFSFQLGVYLEWLDTKKLFLHGVYSTGRDRLFSLGVRDDNKSLLEQMVEDGVYTKPVKSRNLAYQYGILEAFKILSK